MKIEITTPEGKFTYEDESEDLKPLTATNKEVFERFKDLITHVFKEARKSELLPDDSKV